MFHFLAQPFRDFLSHCDRYVPLRINLVCVIVKQRGYNWIGIVPVKIWGQSYSCSMAQIILALADLPYTWPYQRFSLEKL